MMPHRGTVASSDFNSILSNLNRASEQFTSEATERLLPEEEEATKTPSLRFISATDNQPGGTFDPATGVFTPLSGTDTPVTDVKTPVTKRFSKSQVATGVANSGMTFDEFAQLDVETANEFIKGDKIGEPVMKRDIETIMKCCKRTRY